MIGDHFGGPSWRTEDGSTVTAARVDGVTVDPTAIPWLLLERTPAGVGVDRRPPRRDDVHPARRDGRRAHAARRALQRPHRGHAREVPYTADYVFWKERTA